MDNSDSPIVDLQTLHRDLYFIMSLLLADQAVSKIEDLKIWTKSFYEAEVRKLLLGAATAIRSLLNLRNDNNHDYDKQCCGEYWSDLESDKEE